MSATRQGVSLVFVVSCPLTRPGQYVAVVGDSEELGGWDPSCALICETTPNTFPLWITRPDACVMRSPAVRSVFKYVIVDEDGTIIWERGVNREVTGGGVVCSTWESPQAPVIRMEGDGLRSTAVVEQKPDGAVRTPSATPPHEQVCTLSTK